jgi:uncharacterized protein YycO
MQITQTTLLLLDTMLTQAIKIATTIAEITGKSDEELKQMISEVDAERKSEMQKILDRQGGAE